MVWRKRSDEEAIWLQYGDFADGADDVLLTISRRRDAEIVEIQLRLVHLEDSNAISAELPRRAAFSFDCGETSTFYAGGTGFIVAAEDGRIYFTTGPGQYAKDLSAFRSVLASMKGVFGIVIEDRSFDFEIDLANQETLTTLFSVGEIEDIDCDPVAQ